MAKLHERQHQGTYVETHGTNQTISPTQSLTTPDTFDEGSKTKPQYYTQPSSIRRKLALIIITAVSLVCLGVLLLKNDSSLALSAGSQVSSISTNHQNKRQANLPDCPFKCNDGKCIPKVWVCDGYDDCNDNEDEYCQCDTWEFNCTNGRCIYDALVCNNKDDCGDESDEDFCEDEIDMCPADRFLCDNESKCLPGSWQCDNIKDCDDGTDEAGCMCESWEFRCDNERCVSERKVCDGVDNCGDGSDENDCEMCPEGQFSCDEIECILESWVCDGLDDCDDRTDESGCTCKRWEYQCGNGRCISNKKKCDGRDHCGDGTDESNCPQLSTTTETIATTSGPTCNDNEFQCPESGSCIDASYVCDVVVDCTESMADEMNCCDDAIEFSCPSGGCIPQSFVCDGNDDCADSADEVACPTPTSPECTEAACLDSGDCIPTEWLCDTFEDCSDASDEMNCAGCNEDEFSCLDKGDCISLSWVCDSFEDCSDASDEMNCPATTSMTPSNTTNTSQTTVTPATTSMAPSNTTNASQTTVTPATCGTTEFTCVDNGCVPQSYVCDSFIDCTDGSDEAECSVSCEPNHSLCGDGSYCIINEWLCDGYPDCVDLSDESDCVTDLPTTANIPP